MEIVVKITGAVLILMASSYLALEINKGMTKELEQLKGLYNIMLKLKSELYYLNNPLPECFLHLSKQVDFPFDKWFYEMYESMSKEPDETFGDIWVRCTTNLIDNSAMSIEDVEGLFELKDKLGCMDREVQEKAIDYFLIQAEEMRKQLFLEYSQRKKVIITLCAFVGLMTLILLF
ncbi:MAG: stage III sporulation protein AB [Lachnospiraceae bacterium]|nr:stage III sporulation protein AB [Lachnospiraceae bacterium]